MSWPVSASQLHAMLKNNVQVHIFTWIQSEYLLKPGEFQVVTDSRQKDFPYKVVNIYEHLTFISIEVAYLVKKIRLSGKRFIFILFLCPFKPLQINRSEEKQGSETEMIGLLINDSINRTFTFINSC